MATYTINLVNDKLVYTKGNEEYEHFISTRDQTGHAYIPGDAPPCEGTFYKLVKVKKGFVELSYGYFENYPKKFYYVATGQWGDAVAILLNVWDWGNRCVWELGMEKIRPIRYVNDHIESITQCIREICESVLRAE